MHTHPSPRHPFKALVAIVATFAAVHGAGAHADMRAGGDGIDDVRAVGPLSLHQACPGLDDEELVDELSRVGDEVEKPSAIW